ncbi:hypothetical protein DPMN_053046 [Dreissena polymorpha]|uniref:SEC63 domain-containing protein n=1 Tax=Dreissena polymorpha TaxID=45954 RepID=A0A9D4HQB2_DREPO|nr:hypothetical protein DPMN_053046 [Dreissena polymorpha]
MGSIIKKCVHALPQLDLEATIQPITRTVLRVRLVITPMFHWDDKVTLVLVLISLLLFFMAVEFLLCSNFSAILWKSGKY